VTTAGSRFAVFVLLGMVVSVVFMCGLYVGSAFMEMHTTDLDSQSALFIFKESPNRLRGAVRSLEDFFEGHRATPPPANPHGQNDQAMGASAHSMAVPAGVAVPRPPAVQEVKQEVKPEIKPEIEPEIEPEVKPVAQPKAKPAEPKVERQAEAPVAVEKQAEAPVAVAAAAAAVIAPEAAKPKKQEAEDGPYPVPLGHEDKAVYLDSSASKGAKLSFPYDFPSMTLSAWIYMPQARATNTMNTILGNKASGCETNAERMGYSLYVNSWETSDRQLIFEWGNEQSGCNKLVSGRGEGHLIEFDKWTHVAAAIDADSATIYINGVQVSFRSLACGRLQSSASAVGIGTRS
jgi:cell division protein FtsN